MSFSSNDLGFTIRSHSNTLERKITMFFLVYAILVFIVQGTISFAISFIPEIFLTIILILVILFIQSRNDWIQVKPDGIYFPYNVLKIIFVPIKDIVRVEKRKMINLSGKEVNGVYIVLDTEIPELNTGTAAFAHLYFGEDIYPMGDLELLFEAVKTWVNEVGPKDMTQAKLMKNHGVRALKYYKHNLWFMLARNALFLFLIFGLIASTVSLFPGVNREYLYGFIALFVLAILLTAYIKNKDPLIVLLMKNEFGVIIHDPEIQVTRFRLVMYSNKVLSVKNAIVKVDDQVYKDVFIKAYPDEVEPGDIENIIIEFKGDYQKAQEIFVFMETENGRELMRQVVTV